MRKVLILRTEDTSTGTGSGYAQYHNWVLESAKRMGYTPDSMVLGDDQTGMTNVASTGGYEFAIVVHPFSWDTTAFGNGWLGNLMDGDYLPVFVVNHVEIGAPFSALLGVNRNQSASNYFITFDGLGELPLNCATMADQDTAGHEITPLAWETSNSTNLAAWKMTSGTYNIYGSAEAGGSGSTTSLLPIMMQYAINDGQITAPDKKLFGTFDIDDWPTDAEGHEWTADEAQKLVDDLKQAKMVTTVGIPASKTVEGRNQLAQVWEPNGVNAVIRKNQIRNGGPLYPIEHHGSTWWTTVEISGDPSGGQTKAAIDTFYRDHVDNMHDHGIYQGWNADGLDSYGYHYFNTNRVDDKGLQLATPRNIKFADPADTTAKLGYGWKVARMDDNSTHRVIGSYDTNLATQISDYLGILLVGSTSPMTVTDQVVAYASNADDYARLICQGYLTMSAVASQPVYMHGGNGDDYLNTTIDQPLRIVIDKIGLINNFCKNTFRCGHPSEYA